MILFEVVFKVTRDCPFCNIKIPTPQNVRLVQQRTRRNRFLHEARREAFQDLKRLQLRNRLLHFPFHVLLKRHNSTPLTGYAMFFVSFQDSQWQLIRLSETPSTFRKDNRHSVRKSLLFSLRHMVVPCRFSGTSQKAHQTCSLHSQCLQV